MRLLLGISIISSALLFIQCANAACPVSGDERVVLKSTVDGETFLTSNGEIAVDGVIAPGADGSPGPMWKSEAKTALLHALSDKAVSIASSGANKDRYGRIRAQVFVDGLWLQGLLLRSGLVRAAPHSPAGLCANELLAAETDARMHKRGHWGDGHFRILSPDELTRAMGTFALAEGRVTEVTNQKGRIYLNFGTDWRTDFTVTVAKEDAPRFRAAHINLRHMNGHQVRVRGWVQSYYGPEIEIAWPGAIEDLEPDKTRPKKKRPGRKSAEPKKLSG